MTAQLAGLLAGILGLSGVIFGAFGAHALSARLSESQAAAWDTAVLYQLVHALALLLVSIWIRVSGQGVWLNRAAWAYVAGVILFSGSIYLLALGGPRWLGPVTPLGGTALIVGWACLVMAALKH